MVGVFAGMGVGMNAGSMFGTTLMKIYLLKCVAYQCCRLPNPAVINALTFKIDPPIMF